MNYDYWFSIGGVNFRVGRRECFCYLGTLVWQVPETTPKHRLIYFIFSYVASDEYLNQLTIY